MRKFFEDRHGTSGLEFALVAPIILLLLMGSITFFLILRVEWRLSEANQVISEYVARQSTMSDNQFEVLESLFDYINSDTFSEYYFQVGSVKYKNGSYYLEWQFKSNGGIAQIDLSDYNFDNINEYQSYIVVETYSRTTPFFDIVSNIYFDLEDKTLSRPRYVSAVVKK